jgi:hypothetical protein
MSPEAETALWRARVALTPDPVEEASTPRTPRRLLASPGVDLNLRRAGTIRICLRAHTKPWTGGERTGNVRPGERSDMWPGTAASPEQSRIKGGATGQRSRRAAGKDLPLRTTPELPPSATRPARVVSDVIGLDALAGHLLATSRLFDGLPLASLGVSRRGSRSLLVPKHQAMVAVGTMSQLVPKTRHREADLPYDSPVIPDPLTRRLCPAGVRNPDQRERRRARPWHPLG